MINRLFFFILAITCNQCVAQKASSTLDISSLYNCWTDSREETSLDSSFSIFRPCDFKSFPASRFRFRIEFKENGECSWLNLAPNDAHYMVQGTWSYDKEKRIITVKDQSGNVFATYKPISIAGDIMKVEKKTYAAEQDNR
jgi:hypothetical protein